MNVTVIKKLPPVEEIIQQFPLSEEGHERIHTDREEVKNILAGTDRRLLAIVGPCSAWPKEAVYEYAKRLKVLNEEVKDALKVVMRVYIQKPRTTKGWTGPINQPDPLGKPDIGAGVRYCREMMIRVIEMGLPIADEALFTHNAKGFLELLSWVAIGARSSEDQEHRVFASAIDCAVGMKNPTHGSLEIGVNSLVAAQFPHLAVFDGYEVRTNGNPYAHLVLRGGAKGSNYGIEDIEEAIKNMDKHQIQNPSIIVDASHDNSKIDGVKQAAGQLKAVRDVLENMKKHPKTREYVKGFMIESFIHEGSQKVDPEHPELLDLTGCSITDPCISFEQTEVIMRELAQFKRDNP